MFDIVLKTGYNTIAFFADALTMETENDHRNMHLMLTDVSIQ